MHQTVNDKHRVSRRTLAVALLLACVLLFFAFRGVNWKEMLDTMRQGRFEFLSLAFLLLSISIFIRALRWRVLLSAEKLLPAITVFWATAIGYLGNNFLPARAGEFIRTGILSRNSGIGVSFVFATTLTERIMDAVALVLVALVALRSLPELPDWLRVATQAMAILALLALSVILIAPRITGLIKKLLTRLPLPKTFGSRLIDLTEQFLLGMRAFQHPKRALSFTILTVVVWLMDSLVAISVAWALNLSLTLPKALLLLAALGLSSAAPSTPGYVGIYQFVATTILIPLGFSRAEALAFIITFQATIYGAVIVWGSTGFWQLGRAELGTPGISENAPYP
jgi:uncharacterized protein (TIRG00374 family)